MPKQTTKAQKEKSRLSKEEWREFTMTVWDIANTRHTKHPAVFPVEIPKRLVKLFSFCGEIILDPFAGVGTTAKAAIPLGRKVVCVEQNTRYLKMIEKECSGLQQLESEKDVLMLIQGDSRKLDCLEDESVDLIVTSPPYWNKADYGRSPNNLGNINNYKEFLGSICPVFGECYRVLRPGRKICIITANVNQHTNHGLLTFPLAADFVILLRETGFVMINEIIWNKNGTGGRWGSWGTQRPIFGSYPYPPNFLFKNVHEYILIFAKPSRKRTCGPKVVSYSTMMGVDG